MFFRRKHHMVRPYDYDHSWRQETFLRKFEVRQISICRSFSNIYTTLLRENDDSPHESPFLHGVKIFSFHISPWWAHHRAWVLVSPKHVLFVTEGDWYLKCTPYIVGIYWVYPLLRGFLGGQTARVPSQGYHHFPYELMSWAVIKLEVLRWDCE